MKITKENELHIKTFFQDMYKAMLGYEIAFEMRYNDSAFSQLVSPVVGLSIALLLERSLKKVLPQTVLLGINPASEFVNQFQVIFYNPIAVYLAALNNDQ